MNMDTLDFAERFVNIGNGPGYGDTLSAMGYTHVVSMRPNVSRWPACLVRERQCIYSLWCGFVFFKQEPDLAQLELSAASGIVVMENRQSFCCADTREYLGGLQFCAAELTGTELSQWIEFFRGKVENQSLTSEPSTWFYSALAPAVT